MLENPSMLSRNPMGAFTRTNLMSYGTAALGVAIGLVIADVTDRAVATRKPADAADGTKANNRWYGRDAAAAYRMRPDAWRLGAQAGGAVVALGLAYWTRGQRLLPWLLGGTAIGFGANLLKMLTDWWLMPAVLKVKDPSEISLANQLYPLEQAAIQDQVADIFKNWSQTGSLNDGQKTGDQLKIQSPLVGPGADVYTLGARPQLGVAANGGRTFIRTGRLGMCPSCSGYNGCYSDCSTQCADCTGYQPNKKCTYQVQSGDDLYAMASAAGVNVNDVSAMNGGGTPDSYWTVGNTVTLPYGICMLIERALVPASAVTPPADLLPAITRLSGVPATGSATNGSSNGTGASAPSLIAKDPEVELLRFGFGNNE